MPELTPSLQSGQAGIYGKLSSHGDFLLRRLPQGFVVPWDAWLQLGIAESKVALGSTWEDHYGAAPVWRFMLPAGVCGQVAWAGLLQPSIDRVGRHFPLTVATELPANINVLESMMSASAWYASLEREAAAAFDADVQLDALDWQLQQLLFPLNLISRADLSDDTLPGGERIFSALRVTVPPPQSPDQIRATLQCEQVVVGPYDCIWSQSPVDDRPAALLLTKSLPSPSQFCAMLDGKWGEHGWEIAG